MKIGFEKYNLQDEILKSLKDLGYNKPTKVQEKVIGEALLNKDLLVKAQTGTGKTAAFVIPICEKIKWEDNNPQALILSPTRELAIQINEDVKNIGRYKRIKSTALYGKSPFKDQERELKAKCHIVIGTPGRVLDHIDRGTFNVKELKYLVIDEADEMLNMGFIKQIEGVIRRIPKKKVTMLFSATLPEEIKSLSAKYLDRPVEIKIESENLVTDNVQHKLYKIPKGNKNETLDKVLLSENPETCVVFCKTKERVDNVYDFLSSKGYSTNKIHGGMLQKDRTEAMDKFKKGKFKILVATDVASRGIDVLGITHVINYDVPVEKEAYVHRIGRAGRAGHKGKAITLCESYEDRLIKEIEEYIGFEIEEDNIDDLKVLNENEEKLKSPPKIKLEKSANINKGIMKLYFNGGKKKKIRAVDFVGTISNINGVNAEDIGIIDIQELGSYVEILNNKGKIVLKELQSKTIKGKKLKVEIANK
ncbi:MAG: DEAD/DEAH box helicase [Clostridiales bacterium]|nr:DEAD/DEAH box helicase [Clostridiales bacterium]